ncbi:MAG TPA: hypothetical protein VIK02_05755 [Candidatus Anoxymicrobiaceae bacterium]
MSLRMQASALGGTGGPPVGERSDERSEESSDVGGSSPPTSTIR